MTGTGTGTGRAKAPQTTPTVRPSGGFPGAGPA
jgi:hypothetical protein